MEMMSSSVLHVFAVALLIHEGNSAGDFVRSRVARHTDGFCPEGWYTFDDKCYQAFGVSYSDRKYWADADMDCQRKASQLVSIHSEEEQELVSMLVFELRSAAWIGLRRSTPSGSGGFYWKDSTSLDFTNWAGGQPNDAGNIREDCVDMHYDNLNLGEWSDSHCNSRHPYICKREKDPTLTRPPPYPSLCTVPDGWIKMRSSCYKVFKKTDNSVSWLQAQSLCKSYGGNLVRLNGWAVTTMLRIQLKGLDGPFWTGIKSTINNKFTWLGTHPLVFTNWQNDQPKEVNGKQACVAIDEEGEWMVRDCKERHPFICEVTTESLETPTIEPLHPNMTCPYKSGKWHDLGGRYCYIIDVGAKLKWREALCRCTDAGGSLASFHSLREVNVIQHYVKYHHRSLHIGLWRDTNGRFVWSDGSPADYFNWDDGQPNLDKQRCAEMITDTGKWNDISCDNRFGYVCSALKVPVRNESVSTSVSLKVPVRNQSVSTGVSLKGGEAKNSPVIIAVTVISILAALISSAF